jgi:hypothetical protein
MALTKISPGVIKSGAALSNLGYTPVNKAGDTMTGNLTLTDSTTALTANRMITNYDYSNNGGYVGYIGSDMTAYGSAQLYNLGFISSSASTNSSVNWVNVYTSGHWGQYTKVIVYCINTYYNPGFAVWFVDGTTVSNIHGYGAYGSVTSSQTTVGTGTHSGQNVYRYNLTFNNSGTYTTCKWVVGVMAGGGGVGHIGSNYSQSTADDLFRPNGGGVHFLTLSQSTISGSPQYHS